MKHRSPVRQALWIAFDAAVIFFVCLWLSRLWEGPLSRVLYAFAKALVYGDVFVPGSTQWFCDILSALFVALIAFFVGWVICELRDLRMQLAFLHMKTEQTEPGQDQTQHHSRPARKD